jgi:hypothetical protein
LTPDNHSDTLASMKVATKKGSLAGRIQVRTILDDAAQAKGGSVSKQRARALEDHADFPAPLDVLTDGHGRKMPIWAREAIENYAGDRSTAPGRPAAEPVKG